MTAKEGYVSESVSDREIQAKIPWIARSDVPVLIRGDSGSGKERIAQDIALQSKRDASLIRDDKPYNEVERRAHSCMTAVLGRMAVESGQRIAYEEALASNLELAPDLNQISSLDHTAPVRPDADRKYPIAMPGRTKVL